jgi:hypothetical protein
VSECEMIEYMEHSENKNVEQVGTSLKVITDYYRTMTENAETLRIKRSCVGKVKGPLFAKYNCLIRTFCVTRCFELFRHTSVGIKVDVKKN